MKLLRNGKVVCVVDNENLVIQQCNDADIETLFKELQRDGLEMRISKVTKTGIDELIELVPYEKENKYILVDNLRRLGFEVQL